jgi:hypothetical protein
VTITANRTSILRMDLHRRRGRHARDSEGVDEGTRPDGRAGTRDRAGGVPGDKMMEKKDAGMMGKDDKMMDKK